MLLFNFFISSIVSLVITTHIKSSFNFDFSRKPNGTFNTWLIITLIGMLGLWMPLIILTVLLPKIAPDKYRNNNRNNRYYNQNTFNNAYRNPTQQNTYVNKNMYNYYNTYPNYYQPPQNHAGKNPYNLPSKEKGRAKIVSKFSSKYNLFLTDSDVKNVVSATYMSMEWASEVYEMQKKYNSLYEWLGQGNTWLRVYLHSFTVQTVSPIFSEQEEIVFETFDKVFSDICIDESLPVEVVVENINRKYFTTFDETTFRMAINYMESKGKSYKFGGPILASMKSDLDTLTRKYQNR